MLLIGWGGETLTDRERLVCVVFPDTYVICRVNRQKNQYITRADIQRKPLGFQEVTSSKYRCVEFCVVDLVQSEELLIHSLDLKTKENLEQPCNTSLLQSAFR